MGEKTSKVLDIFKALHSSDDAEILTDIIQGDKISVSRCRVEKLKSLKHSSKAS